MLHIDIHKSFDDFTLQARLDVPRGITAVFGPSGSGKTSLIRAVAGLLKGGEQVVRLGDVDLARLPPHRRRIGYVYQDARLFPHLSVLQNLRYGGRQDEDAIIGLLGLAPLLTRTPTTLSGGEAQRVALGRALMSGPDIMLLDEPLSALDAPRKAAVMPYLEALRDHAAIPMIYVSHDMAEVARLAGQLVVLDAGQVVVSGPLDAVLSDPKAAPFIGLQDAGAVLTGRVVGHADDGLTKVETEAGALWVPLSQGRAGGMLRVRIPAQDVILSRSAPAQMSALNVLPVTVTALEHGSGTGVIVGLATGLEAGLATGLAAGEAQSGQAKSGQAKLLARITKRSAKAMDLTAGDRVFAILKATAIAPADVS